MITWTDLDIAASKYQWYLIIYYFQINIIGINTEMADELPDIPKEDSTSKRRMSVSSETKSICWWVNPVNSFLFTGALYLHLG